jgi:hypothetical protein
MIMMLRSLARQTRYPSRLFHATAAAEAKLTVEQLAEKVDLKGKNVLVRVDLNVPLAKVSAVVALLVTVIGDQAGTQTLLWTQSSPRVSFST